MEQLKLNKEQDNGCLALEVLTETVLFVGEIGAIIKSVTAHCPVYAFPAIGTRELILPAGWRTCTKHVHSRFHSKTFILAESD